MNKNDLIGQRFGKLTVLRLATQEEKKTKNNREWICQCDCGNITVVRTAYLNNGHTRSCGCLVKETCGKLFSKDLTGQRFGKLIALKRLEKKYLDGSYYWLCQCDCGNQCEIVGNHLTRGDVSSCGCLGKSKGEYLIEQILLKNNINYQREYSFNDLKGKKLPLRFDFAIFNNENKLECLIEFQGQQHYDGPHGAWVNDIRPNDQLKREYCQSNNIPLIEVPYFDIDDITLDYLKGKITQ